MNEKKVFRWTYILSVILATVGLLFKIQHWPNGNNILSIGLLFSIVYIFIGIQSIMSKPRMQVVEKGAWVACFIFFSAITGLVYMILKPENDFYKKSCKSK